METALVPIKDLQELAKAVVRSRLFPSFDNEEKAFVLMSMAQVEGCHPMQAALRYDVIQGRPAKKTDAILADFQARGGAVKWLQLSATVVEAEFSAKALAAPVRVKWDQERATAAQLWGKDMWKKYPQNMLRARCISEGVRLADPAVIAGLYTPEEVQDFEPAKTARQVASAPSDQTRSEPSSEQLANISQAIDAEFEALGDETVKLAKAVDEKAHKAKVKELAIAMSNAGIKEKAEVLSWCRARAKRDNVETRNDLTDAEIDAMLSELAKGAQG